ncbi:ATP-binding protein [Paenibacillus sp. HWE-109]|uniref:sensor histidine kinase n=1 Tax=Paenibacillus sp. HWE-109 TaxID=1306526 RepID=UPI001EE0CE76|nr:ATP-binding protein [Paenibacillus sp. HWE-109]UKS31056.1 ATP-binding protein [Paenibacillus sp. HWE-109]
MEKQDEAVHFFVSDTGIGMNEDQISRLLTHDGTKNRGIGLLNTHCRLTRLYGAGLQIQSKPGEGTTVSFKISEANLILRTISKK